MAKGFDISAVFADLPVVPESGTGEQVKKISADLIDSDDRNFYELSGIDELASNILTVGLLDPIRVRPTENGRYTIVSGHRRRAAMQKLLEDGHDEFSEIPCIVDAGDMSPELQELRLIFANSDTRRMSNGDLMRQTERVQRLLYDLKEQGYEFPGRMRDYVSEACKISKTKLSNINIIRDHLDPHWMPLYDKGTISEQTALALAHMTPQQQTEVFAEWRGHNRTVLYESTVSQFQRLYEDQEKMKCPKTKGACTNTGRKVAKQGASYFSCSYNSYCGGKCCNKCDELGTCKYACQLLADKIKKIKADKKEAKKQAAEAAAAADAPHIAKLQQYWRRFSDARKQAGKGVAETINILPGRYYTSASAKEFQAYERGDKTPKKNDAPPFLPTYQSIDAAQSLIKIADFLGCSLDYLFCRTDVRETAVEPDPIREAMQAPQADLWHSGPDLPDHPCMLVCKFQMQDGGVQTALCHYDGNALYVCHQDTHWGSDIVDIDPNLDSVTKSKPVSWMELEGETR